jgi:1-deoxyxylulose-5-phosphate synthase
VLEQVCIEVYASEANLERLERAGGLAAEKGLTIAQVAFAYVMNQPSNIFAVVGPQSGTRFKENREACLLRFTAEEIAWLDLTGER